MSDTPRMPDDLQIPEAVATPPRRWSVSLVWLIPAIAALIGGWLALNTLLERGPTITISFKTAEGIEAGKTRIKYRSVDVGEVRSIQLSEDRQGVEVTAQLTKQAESLLAKDTHFWVVRPRISGSSVTGISTLLTGSHIGMDVGKSTETSREFIGLEQPSIVTAGMSGRQFILHSEDVGSLDLGSPVYFRGIQAGQLVAFDLDKDGKGVTMKVFINTPYDQFVNINTRFWNANGIDFKVDANGFKVNTESVVSILLGGLAFQTLDGAKSIPAPANTTFNVFADRTEALKLPDTVVEAGVMVFKESVRGLLPGAAIDFRGIVIGEVVAISVDYDPVKKDVNVPVYVQLYPDRLRSKYRKLPSTANPIASRELLGKLIERGLRAQLRTGNLLTGQLYIALDFFPKTAKVNFDINKNPLELPTIPGSLQELQATLASIAAKLEKVPFDAIGEDLRQTLQNANKLLTQLDTEIVPEARGALTDVRRTLSSIERAVAVDSPLHQDAHETLREVARAAASFRVLADYLERHPESLLRGKKEDGK